MVIMPLILLQAGLLNIFSIYEMKFVKHRFSVPALFHTLI